MPSASIGTTEAFAATCPPWPLMLDDGGRVERGCQAVRNPSELAMNVRLTSAARWFPCTSTTVIKRLVTEGLRDKVKVMVGGAPVTPEWAEKIGADAYANNAPEAVEIAKKLVGVAR